MLLAGAGALVMLAARPPGESLETVNLTRPPVEAPAMCPWRDPQRDMQAFFPGATTYHTEILILSSLRLQIIRRLGPNTSLEANALYVYRVLEGRTPRGAALVRRTAGQHGALEVVVGVGPDGRVVGVRLQRQREPAAIAEALTSPAWLGAFRAKTADSAWRLGGDVPAVPAAANTSAEAIVRAVRSLLIEYDVGEKNADARHQH